MQIKNNELSPFIKKTEDNKCFQGYREKGAFEHWWNVN
jgi:hypothetical protein